MSDGEFTPSRRRRKKPRKPRDPDKPRERKVRPPPELSAHYLHDQARIHQMRFVPTVLQMRRVLRRRVDKCIRFHGGEREDGYALVEQVLGELAERGSLDDARVARAWLDTLQRRGTSSRGIRHKLREKGVASDVIDQLLAEHDQRLRDEEGVDPERERAIAYAKRRRLGPWQPTPERRAARRDKDLAAMARQGFGYGLAKDIVDGDEEAEPW